MWNSLLKTVLGGAGQGVRQIQKYIAPKPQPAKTISQEQMVNRYNFAPKLTPQNSVSMSGLQQGIKSGGLKVNSTPAGSSFNVSSPTTSGNTSYFRNSLSSLSPTVYAAGADTSNILQSSPWEAKTPSLTSTGNTWQDLLSNIAGGVKSIVTQSGKQGGTWNLPFNLGSTDFGITEAFGQNKGYSLPSSSVTSKTNVSNNTDLVNRLINDAMNKGTKFQGQTPPSISNSNLITDFNSIDQMTNDKINQIKAEADAGRIDQEEAYRQIQQAQDEANNLLYDQMVQQYKNQVPIINSEFDMNKKTLDQSIIDAANQGKTVKTTNANTFGEAARKIVGNRDISQQNIDNVFSAAGAAGGSQYLNAQTSAINDAANAVAKNDTTLAQANSDIDRQQQNFELQVKDKINQLTLDKQKALQAIQDNIDMKNTEKLAASKELNAQFAQNMVNLQNYYQQQNDAFTALKYQLVTNSGELAKNAAVTPYMTNPTSYNAGTDPNATGNTRPVRQYDPIKGQYYYIDPVTGQKMYAGTGQGPALL